MERDEALKLENQICFAIYACAREITKLYHPVLKELGLTYTQYIAMLALWERDRVTVKELGERLYLDSGTLTPLLKKLESLGYVLRARDRSDERQLLIEVTEAGRALKEKAFDVPEKVFCRTGLPTGELVEIREKMTELIRSIHPAEQTPASPH
ncbi:MarR family winged helix-turn-helix transcriptional regulator [Cohnella sp. REN36]|uniref:MarR family winged helix-turn-helix transcriptional regulator n=1 Tax=Cohnella sp. REN36 TaxID=2887347 RepID=UPI001D15CC70|nr:MarR family transcriptional regulator [Cohnella sp. REN36]MCC3373444.1 MarR family transcriptional regulator [Cohnella sp. REN36]